MNGPSRFAEYLSKEPYHPRSNKHSNALLEFLLADLLIACPRFQEDARAGKLVYELNRKVRVGTSEWNVDLAVGSPVSETKMSENANAIRKAQPSTIKIACEAKSIMTEHRKAQRNRQRDLDALHQFMHRYDQNTMVAAITVINISNAFRSPLRSKITKHKDPITLVQTAVDLLRTVPVRSHPTNGPGLEANAVIVVNYDNSRTKLVSEIVEKPPAPQPGDPLHWNSLVNRLCDLYIQRWAR
jgi:hypothetical protein